MAHLTPKSRASDPQLDASAVTGKIYGDKYDSKLDSYLYYGKRIQPESLEKDGLVRLARKGDIDGEVLRLWEDEEVIRLAELVSTSPTKATDARSKVRKVLNDRRRVIQREKGLCKSDKKGVAYKLTIAQDAEILAAAVKYLWKDGGPIKLLQRDFIRREPRHLWSSIENHRTKWSNNRMNKALRDIVACTSDFPNGWFDEFWAPEIKQRFVKEYCEQKGASNKTRRQAESKFDSAKAKTGWDYGNAKLTERLDHLNAVIDVLWPLPKETTGGCCGWATTTSLFGRQQ